MGEVPGYLKTWSGAVSQADVSVLPLPQTEEFILYPGDGLTSAQEPHLTHIYFRVFPAISEAWFPLLFSYMCCAYG